MAEQPAKTTKKVAAAAKKRPARTKAQVEQELGDAQKKLAEAEASRAKLREVSNKAMARASAMQAEVDEMRERLDMVGADLLVPREGNGAATPAFVDACMAPFDEEEVGKLPVGRCDDCKARGFGNSCNKHEWLWNCGECGNHHTSALTHLDYVGHADLTKRLLDLDPGWYWEPMGRNPNGTPVIETGSSTAAMWINLTVNGVTRIGVGTAQRSKDEVLKELIGDALRNAAMRFGIALDLWAKGDRKWTDHLGPSEESGDPDIVAVKASKEQVAQLGKAIAAIKPDGKRNALKLALAELYGKASEMRADSIAGAVGFVQSFDWVEPTVDEAAAKLVEEFDGTEESVDKTGTPTTPADSPSEAVEDPSGGVPEEIAPETQEEADTAGSDDGRAEKLETIRVAFLSLKGKQAKAGRDALKAGDWFPLDKIPTDQLDQAAAALADAVGA